MSKKHKCETQGHYVIGRWQEQLVREGFDTEDGARVPPEFTWAFVPHCCQPLVSKHTLSDMVEWARKVLPDFGTGCYQIIYRLPGSLEFAEQLTFFDKLGI